MALNLVTLPDIWLERCRQFGAQVVADYAAGRSDASKAVSCFDAEKNIVLQQKAKMCECAFARFVGADLDRDVHWARRPDAGCDLKWGDARWDVKATSINSRYLIWPIAKNGIFDSKAFDCLVLVKHDEPRFVISGWITKEAFRVSHEVAGEGHKLFPGTWFVDECALWPASSILEQAA